MLFLPRRSIRCIFESPLQTHHAPHALTTHFPRGTFRKARALLHFSAKETDPTLTHTTTSHSTTFTCALQRI